jgi:hypothetical protein
MYFFSGAEWRLKVMPASFVTSRKRTLAVGLGAGGETTLAAAARTTARTASMGVIAALRLPFPAVSPRR